MEITAADVAKWLNENKRGVVFIAERESIKKLQNCLHDVDNNSLLFFIEEVHDYSQPNLCMEIPHPNNKM